jgi:hypothetical protein
VIFETNLDVLNWYEKQPRALTKEFLDSIRWEDVKKYPLDKRFVPVLFYMRDVESLTDIYYKQLLRTPTGKDKVIASQSNLKAASSVGNAARVFDQNAHAERLADRASTKPCKKTQ